MKSNQFSILFKHSIIYGIGQVSVSLVAFILMPIFTDPQYLPVAEYGIWQILNITMTVLVIVLSLGMATTLFRFYYDEKEVLARKATGNTIFWLLLVCAFLFLAIDLLMIQPFVLPRLRLDSSIQTFFPWIVFAAVLQTGSIVPLNILRAEEKPWHYISFQVLQFILLLLFLIVFLVYFKWQLKGIVYGYVFAFLGNFLLLLISYRKHLRFQIDFVILKRMVKFGLPLMVVQLGGWFLSVFDRYLIGYQLNYSAAAVYSVGYQFGMVMNLAIIMPFSVAWGPFMFKVFKEPDAKNIYARTLNYITFLTLYAAFIISTFSKEILLLFTESPQYLEAQSIVSIVAFAHVFYGMYYVFTSGLNVTNRTYYFPFIILAAAAFNILANYLLIPRLQLIAPAFITAVSYGILAFLTYFYSQKFYDIPFEFRRILLLFGVFFSFGILGYYWNYRQPVVFFTVKIVMLLLPVITLYLCKFFKPEELNFIKTRVFKLFYG